MEEEREAQERTEAAMKLKAQKRDDISIDRFFSKGNDLEPEATIPEPNPEEEERERGRLLRSVSGRF